MLDDRLASALADSYELKSLVGRGGFAAVYAARDLKLKRDVAIKVLHEELAASTTVQERFRREAEAVAQLRHPHIIPIYAVGDAHGLVFYVMPLIEGEGLRARLDRGGAMPFDEVRRILVQATSALVAAHRAGFVHRDIKPDNILLDGAEGNVLLTDFGIAKALAAPTGESGLTATGMIIGSPEYMSPEQASGETRLDHRSDIYSLGVVAYQMLTGELPFKGDTVQALLMRHLTEDAPPVTERRADCPDDLAAAVARCLAKEPADRWESADALHQALVTETVAARLPVRRRSLPSGPAPSVAAPRQVRRFRRLLAALGGVTALGVAADLITNGSVEFAPFVALAAVAVGASQYARLWTHGYTWRDVMRPPADERIVETPSDSAEFGEHAPLVQQARNDRATLVSLLARIPKAERRGLGGVLPAVDSALARVADAARHLRAIELETAERRARLETLLQAARAAGARAGDYHEARLAGMRQGLADLGVRAAGSAGELKAYVSRLGAAREKLERAVHAGSRASDLLQDLF